MENINSTTLNRLESVGTANPSPSHSNDNEVSALPVQEATQTVNTAQRIDLESVYTSLKAALASNWEIYKNSISLFVRGRFVVLVRALKNF